MWQYPALRVFVGNWLQLLKDRVARPSASWGRWLYTALAEGRDKLYSEDKNKRLVQATTWAASVDSTAIVKDAEGKDVQDSPTLGQLKAEVKSLAHKVKIRHDRRLAAAGQRSKSTPAVLPGVGTLGPEGASNSLIGQAHALQHEMQQQQQQHGGSGSEAVSTSRFSRAGFQALSKVMRLASKGCDEKGVQGMGDDAVDATLQRLASDGSTLQRQDHMAKVLSSEAIAHRWGAGLVLRAPLQLAELLRECAPSIQSAAPALAEGLLADEHALTTLRLTPVFAAFARAVAAGGEAEDENQGCDGGSGGGTATGGGAATAPVDAVDEAAAIAATAPVDEATGGGGATGGSAAFAPVDAVDEAAAIAATAPVDEVAAEPMRPPMRPPMQPPSSMRPPMQPPPNESMTTPPPSTPWMRPPPPMPRPPQPSPPSMGPLLSSSAATSASTSTSTVDGVDGTRGGDGGGGPSGGDAGGGTGGGEGDGDGGSKEGGLSRRELLSSLAAQLQSSFEQLSSLQQARITYQEMLEVARTHLETATSEEHEHALAHDRLQAKVDEAKKAVEEEEAAAAAAAAAAAMQAAAVAAAEEAESAAAAVAAAASTSAAATGGVAAEGAAEGVADYSRKRIASEEVEEEGLSLIAIRRAIQKQL
jgi:hypothetical protein